ncbi:MAG: glucose-6-phosphate isomerase [Bacteroidales bacterium]|nr:glucose-6-phosphate isomerase [Bacteroidales bacterium]
MAGLKLDITNVYPFVSEESILGFQEQAHTQLTSLNEKTGAGNDFLGWLDLPSNIPDDEINKLEEVAAFLQEKAEIIVVLGIGGSYLGAKSIISALSHNFDKYKAGKKGPDVIFAGQNIGEDYLSELIEVLDTHSYAIIVISKSGTTTEPAIAFRILKEHLEDKVGPAEANQRIIAITDKSKGALRELSDQVGYRSFIIPDDVGGRYSVLTPVGLLPIACAGYDIREFIKGAVGLKEQTGPDTPFRENPAALYAAARNALYRNGRSIEILANYNEKLIYFSEWWKQLYGESEGKKNKGIFPASVNFTADLHSMGQYIQEGERILFETVISVSNPDRHLSIPEDKGNLDQLNYLAGKRINEVNKMAELGTLLAHIDGGVPNMRIEIPAINEYHLGELVYFFEIACGISGYLLEVNPFNQPGVEAYKKNMFALLGKPGFESFINFLSSPIILS